MSSVLNHTDHDVGSFPTLFKKSSKGALQTWSVWVEDNVIHTEHGLKDGKKQHDTKEVKRGKNRGKANETTPQEQAILQAESTWKKQQDKGYVIDIKDVDKIVYLPMLAQTFDKRKKYINYPCYVQRKFDGVRCLSNMEDGEVQLRSRKGKVFPHMEHLQSQIQTLLIDKSVYLDGELYSDEMTFQRLVGLVKKQTLSDEDKADMLKIKYRVYDCILPDYPDCSFVERFAFLFKLVEHFKNNSPDIVVTQTIKVEDEESIKRFHDEFVAQGYEGIIIRNGTGPYGINKRSNDLQKHKDFKDDEYKIVGHEEGVGRAEGTVIWICENEDGQKFKVRPRGSEKERQDWFENGSKYYGNQLTVRYQELTDDGIPRFPVGIAIRDYD